jgi:hypothetical protein
MFICQKVFPAIRSILVSGVGVPSDDETIVVAFVINEFPVTSTTVAASLVVASPKRTYALAFGVFL